MLFKSKIKGHMGSGEDSGGRERMGTGSEGTQTEEGAQQRPKGLREREGFSINKAAQWVQGARGPRFFREERGLVSLD